MMSRITAAFAAFAAALFLSACSSPASERHADHQPADEPVIAGQPAGYNADDVAFASNMMPHHQQAVDMSRLVPERSTDPEVIALAEQIAGAQDPEIRALRVFLVQWNENPENNTGHDAHAGHGVTMPGMVDDATMAKLQALRGPEFDTLWLQSMITHHQGAIEMAKAEIANGENIDAKRMAQAIIDAQQAEIAQMNEMLAGNR